MRFAIVAAALLLTACGSGTSTDGAQNDGAASDPAIADRSNITLAPGETLIVAGGSTSRLQAGLWTVSHSRLADRAGRATKTLSQCLTGIDAAQPPASFLAARKDDQSCKFENLAGEGDQLFVTVRCEAAPFFVTVASGTVTATAIDLVGGDTADADTRITARRVGDCPTGQP